MDATSSADLVHTQVHPRRPWRTQGPRPSVRGSKGRRRKKSQLLQAPDIRRPSQNAPEAEPRQPGHTARGPDIRLFPSRRTSGPQPGHPDPAYPESSETGHSSPDIRPASPDIRHLAKARTFGPTPGHPAAPCLRAAHLGRGPCTPSSLRLYILPHLLLVRVSIGLAHM